MNKTQIFPLILILLQLGAGAMSTIAKDYRMAVYWVAAAVLNIAVSM